MLRIDKCSKFVRHRPETYLSYGVFMSNSGVSKRGSVKQAAQSIYRSEIAMEKWEKISAIPLAALALAYLVLYAIEVLGHWSPAVFFDFIKALPRWQHIDDLLSDRSEPYSLTWVITTQIG